MNKQDKNDFSRIADDDRKFNDTKSKPNRVKVPYKRDHKKVIYENYTDDEAPEDFE
jgi:hypothetical protein